MKIDEQIRNNPMVKKTSLFYLIQSSELSHENRVAKPALLLYQTSNQTKLNIWQNEIKVLRINYREK